MSLTPVLIPEDKEKLDKDEHEPEIPPVVFGPTPLQRRQECEFKRRHIEFMTLGFSPYIFS